MPPFVISRCTRQSLGSCNLLCPRGTRSRHMTWCFWMFWMPWYAMLILRYHCEKYGSCQKRSSKKTKRKTKRKATDRLCTVPGDPWGSHGDPMRSHAFPRAFSRFFFRVAPMVGAGCSLRHSIAVAACSFSRRNLVTAELDPWLYVTIYDYEVKSSHSNRLNLLRIP